MNNKKCRVCSGEFSLEEFKRDNRSKDGRKGICRKCDYERYKAWRKTDKGRELENRYWHNTKKPNRQNKICNYCGLEIVNDNKKYKYHMECIAKKEREDARIRHRNKYNFKEYKEYRTANRVKILSRENNNEKKHIDRLTDRYIKKLISKSYGISTTKISDDVIIAKRKHIELIRLLKTSNKGDFNNEHR